MQTRVNQAGGVPIPTAISNRRYLGSGHRRSVTQTQEVHKVRPSPVCSHFTDDVYVCRNRNRRSATAVTAPPFRVQPSTSLIPHQQRGLDLEINDVPMVLAQQVNPTIRLAPELTASFEMNEYQFEIIEVEIPIPIPVDVPITLECVHPPVMRILPRKQVPTYHQLAHSLNPTMPTYLVNDYLANLSRED